MNRFTTTGRDHWHDQPATTRRDGTRYEPLHHQPSMWAKAAISAVLIGCLFAVASCGFMAATGVN